MPPNLPCNLRTAVGAGSVKRRPRVLVLQVDVGPVADQDLHHADVVVEHSLVESRETWKSNDTLEFKLIFTRIYALITLTRYPLSLVKLHI